MCGIRVVAPRGRHLSGYGMPGCTEESAPRAQGPSTHGPSRNRALVCRPL